MPTVEPTPSPTEEGETREPTPEPTAEGETTPTPTEDGETSTATPGPTVAPTPSPTMAPTAAAVVTVELGLEVDVQETLGVSPTADLTSLTAAASQEVKDAAAGLATAIVAAVAASISDSGATVAVSCLYRAADTAKQDLLTLTETCGDGSRRLQAADAASGVVAELEVQTSATAAVEMQAGGGELLKEVVVEVNGAPVSITVKKIAAEIAPTPSPTPAPVTTAEDDADEGGGVPVPAIAGGGAVVVLLGVAAVCYLKGGGPKEVKQPLNQGNNAGTDVENPAVAASAGVQTSVGPYGAPPTQKAPASPASPVGEETHKHVESVVDDMFKDDSMLDRIHFALDHSLEAHEVKHDAQE